MREAQESGSDYDMLAGELRPRVPKMAKKLGQAAGKAYEQMSGGGFGPVEPDPKELWVGMDSATKSRFGGTFGSFLEAYNRGDVDGAPHYWNLDRVGNLTMGVTQ